jgi:tetratricopeptide (TPR) repeat protein
MTSASHTAACPSPETLAAFAEGRLTGAASDAVVAHLDVCEECSHEVALAMRAIDEEGANVVRPRRWRPWLAAVAASIAVIALIPVIRSSFHRAPIERLIALSPKTARAVEPRLTGFAWSPYHGSERAIGSTNADPERMKLAGAAGEVIERAQRDTSSEAQHDAGVALLVTQSPAEAIAPLEVATRDKPSAQTWSDLAAARYAAASELGRAALYPQALAAADAALRIDKSSPEALFNRALILSRMGLVAEARASWQRYLAVDPSTKWANEARAHLSELPR